MHVLKHRIPYLVSFAAMLAKVGFAIKPSHSQQARHHGNSLQRKNLDQEILRPRPRLDIMLQPGCLIIPTPNIEPQTDIHKIIQRRYLKWTRQIMVWNALKLKPDPIHGMQLYGCTDWEPMATILFLSSQNSTWAMNTPSALFSHTLLIDQLP